MGVYATVLEDEVRDSKITYPINYVIYRPLFKQRCGLWKPTRLLLFGARPGRNEIAALHVIPYLAG